MTISWNEVTILWNEVTIFWNEVTVRWNEVTWNEVTMERSDRIPVECVTLKISRHVYTSPLPTGVTTLGVTKVLEFTVRHV